MMTRWQGVFGSGSLVWLRGAVLGIAASLGVQAAIAGPPTPSIRLVPSTQRFAGNGTNGTTSDFGKATTVPLNAPTDVAIDLTGNTYISDTGNNCIRRVGTDGNMSVVAGQPTSGLDTCTTASSVTTYTTGVLQPSGVAVDGQGNLFVADSGHNCVRRLANGSTGIALLQPLVGTCSDTTTNSVAPSPAGLAVDHAGNLYIAINDSTDGIYQVIRSGPSDGYTSVCLVSGQFSTKVPTACPGIPAPNSIHLNAPQGLGLDPIGNLYIADSANSCVRAIVSGAQSTAVGQCTNDMTGSSSTALQTPVSVAADAAGHLFITDTAAAQVQELIAGTLNLVAGDGKGNPYNNSQEGLAAVSVSLITPQGLATDQAGSVYLADTGNNIVRMLSQGLHFAETTTVSSSNLQSVQFVIQAAVNLKVTVGGDYQLIGDTCSGSHAAPGATVVTCQVSLRFHPALPGMRTSALTLTDSTTSPSTYYRFGLNGLGQSAEAIFIPGTINTLAASLASPSAVAIDSAGDVYFAESGTGSGNGSIAELPAGSSTPTVLVAPGAGVATPTALALDAAGNLYIADSTTNSVLRYDANGNLSPFISGLDNPVALAVDPLGDLYIAEDGTTTVGILEVYAGGQQSVIAGQGTNAAPDNVLATTAKFVHPSALYLDSSGVLYLADRGAYRVYQIDTASLIHFFAGNGTPVDTAPGTRLGTGLAGVSGISADPADDLYIADAASNRVFLAYSGSAQNPGMTVLAGDGTPGAIGDNGPANKAELDNPAAIAVDGAANVYIADNGNSSLREITYTDPTLNFGIVKVGHTGGPLMTTLWNAGNDILQTLAPVTIADDSADFSVDPVGTNCGNSLSEGATCNLSYYFTPQTPGVHVGHSIFIDSSVTAQQVVTLNGEAPQTILTAPNVTVVYGNAYTLNATVTGNLTPGPTGSVTFSANGVDLCPAQPLPANGQVSCSPSITPLLDVGVYPITVTYTGDSIYDPATVTLQLTVVPRPVTITADNKTRAINTANPPLTGTVANATVPGQSITATYSTTATISSPAGTYPIVPAAVLGPGVNPADYTIILVNGTLTILAQAQSATLTAPSVTAVYGDAYTLNAGITGIPGTPPTGSITFSLAGASLCPPQPLPANGQVSCSPTLTPLLDMGVYSVTVTYTGDSTYGGTTATMTLTINPRPVTIVANNVTRPINTANPPLTSTVTNAIVPGQSITATESTTATTSSPAGTYPIVPAAVFGSGVNPADYTIALTSGTLTVTDSGGGGGGGGGGSTGSFTVAGGPGEQEIDHSGSVSYSVTLAPTGGFTGAVTLACSGLPESATCAFSPASISLASGASGTSIMTITASADTTNVPTVFSQLRNAPAEHTGGNSPLLAWTMLPLGLGGLGLGVAGRRRRRQLLLLVPFALLLVVFGITGCASPSNYKVYTVTVTGSATSGGATITQSSTVDLVLAR